MFGFKTANVLADWLQDGVVYGHNETRTALNAQPLAKYQELRQRFSAKVCVEIINKTFSTNYKQQDLEDALNKK